LRTTNGRARSSASCFDLQMHRPSSPSKGPARYASRGVVGVHSRARRGSTSTATPALLRHPLLDQRGSPPLWRRSSDTANPETVQQKAPAHGGDRTPASLGPADAAYSVRSSHHCGSGGTGRAVRFASGGSYAVSQPVRLLMGLFSASRYATDRLKRVGVVVAYSHMQKRR